MDSEDLFAGAEVPPVALIKNHAAEGCPFSDHFDEEWDDADFRGGWDALEESRFDEIDAGEEEARFAFGMESLAEVGDSVGVGIEGDLEWAVLGAEHEGDFVVCGLVGGPCLIERQGGEDVTVVDPEGSVFGEECFGGLEAACGFEHLGRFMTETQGATFPRSIRESLGVGFSPPVSVDDKLVYAGLVKMAEGPSDEGFVANGDEGFGAFGSERFESSAESGAENKSGGRRMSHWRRGRGGCTLRGKCGLGETQSVRGRV